MHYGGRRRDHDFRSLYDYYGKRMDYGDGVFPSKWPSEVVQDEIQGWMLRVAPIRDPTAVYDDWEEYNELQLDGAPGRTFYFNRKTYEASYELPPAVGTLQAESVRQQLLHDQMYRSLPFDTLQRTFPPPAGTGAGTGTGAGAGALMNTTQPPQIDFAMRTEFLSRGGGGGGAGQQQLVMASDDPGGGGGGGKKSKKKSKKQRAAEEAEARRIMLTTSSKKPELKNRANPFASTGPGSTT